MGKEGRYFPDLIVEYKKSLKDLRAMGGNASMERDLMEAIEWMQTGYDPAETRSANRIDAYVVDHHLMQDLISYTDSGSYVPYWLKEHEEESDNTWDDEVVRLANIKNKVNGAMEGLTNNERAVFIMIKAELMTFSRVANILGVSRSTVQSYLERAENKIQMNIRYGSQLSLAV